MIYDDHGCGFQLFNLKRWKCLFLHSWKKVNRVYAQYKDIPGTYAGYHNCKKCGMYWSNS